MCMQTILGRGWGGGGNFCSQFMIGASVSEPHTSEIFHIYIYYLPYVVLYILDPVINAIATSSMRNVSKIFVQLDSQQA